MKKLKKMSLVVFFMTCLSAGAMEVKKEGVSLNGDQTLIVELSKVSEGTFISFEDQKGVVLFKDDLLNEGDYYKALNLEIIPQGIYLLKVDKRFTTRVWKIEKTSEGIEIEDSSIVSFKPYFRVQEELVKVFMRNPAENGISLVVEDRNGQVLANLWDKKMVYMKTLDFSNVPKGEYYVTLTKGKERFKEKVVIN